MNSRGAILNKKQIEKDRQKLQRINEKICSDKKKIKKQLSCMADLQDDFGLIDELYGTELPWQKNFDPIFRSLSETIDIAEKAIIPHEVSVIPYLTVASGTASTLVTSLASSATLNAAAMDSAWLVSDPLLRKIKRANKQDKDKRQKEIKSFLQRVFPHLVETYQGVWECFSVNDYDPERGALGKMREVVNQTIKELAPKARRDKMKWKQRYVYVIRHYARNDESKILLENSLKVFLKTAGQLNKFHARNALQKDSVENLLYQAEDLLYKLATNIDLTVFSLNSCLSKDEK